MLTGSQLRLLTAGKTAFAAVLALGIAMALNWERPYWTGITVFITFLPYVGAAFEKSVLRVLGTLFAGFMAYMLTGWFEQDQVMMSLSLFVILGVLSYGAQGKVYPYFFVLGGITLCIIIGSTIVYPELLWHLTLYRTLEVVLGVIVALLVNNLIFPQRASDALRYKVSDVVRETRALLKIACDAYAADQSLPADLDARERQLASRFPALNKLLQSALRDSSRLLHRHHAAEELIRELRQCFVAVGTALRAAESDAPKAFQRELQTEFDDYVDSLLVDLDQLASDLQRGEPARRLQRCHNARETLQRKVQALRAAGVSYGYPIDDATNFYALMGDLNSLQEAMIRLAQADRAIYRDVDANELPERVKHEPGGWRLDLNRVRHGVKVGIASLFALYAYLWLQWPSGVTAFLTCAIVMQVSNAASNQKSMLRLGGCLLGGMFGALALGLLEPHFVTFYGYAVPLFFIFFFFSWINNGPQQYAYAGFQAQLAFLLMTSISNQQSVDLEAGVDRFMGILLGVLIAALVHRMIWPVLPEREFRRELDRFFRHAADFMREQDARITHTREQPAARRQEKDLAQIEYLPQKTLDWLEQIGFSKSEADAKDELTQTYLHAQAIMFGLRGMAQANARELDPKTLDQMRPELTALDHAIADSFLRCADAFLNNKTFERTDAVRNASNQLEIRLSKLLREEKATRTLNYQQLSCFLALARRYRELAALVRVSERQIAELNFSVLKRSAFF